MYLLSCKGVRVANLLVPSFEVCPAEYVGLTIPTDYGSQWAHVISILGGGDSVPEVSVRGQVSAIIPLGLDPCERTLRKQILIDYVCARGLARGLGEQLLEKLGLQSNQRLGELRSYDRTLLDLGRAQSQGAELVVFSSAGLDPLRLRLLREAVLEKLDSCAAIHVYAEALSQYDDAIYDHTKVVHCKVV